MITTQEESTRRLSTRLSHGRVVNAISALLRSQLTVPHIYLKPKVPGSPGIDVMAVDRGGGGDVYGVQIVVWSILPTKSGIRKLLAPMRELPLHYRYFAVQSNGDSLSILARLKEYVELFDPSGIGRYGIMAYDERLLQADCEVSSVPVSVMVEAERFRVRGEKLEILEKFLSRAQPDMQVRI